MLYEWAANKDKPPLILCSGGGNMAAGRAMADIVQASDAPVVANGYVASAALAIYASAKTRWATPSTIFLAHECYMTYHGDPGQIYQDSLAYDSLSLRCDFEWMAKVIAKACCTTYSSPEEWRAEMRGAGFQMDVHEARARGLVKKVIKVADLLK